MRNWGRRVWRRWHWGRREGVSLCKGAGGEGSRCGSDSGLRESWALLKSELNKPTKKPPIHQGRLICHLGLAPVQPGVVPAAMWGSRYNSG